MPSDALGRVLARARAAVLPDAEIEAMERHRHQQEEIERMERAWDVLDSWSTRWDCAALSSRWWRDGCGWRRRLALTPDPMSVAIEVAARALESGRDGSVLVVLPVMVRLALRERATDMVEAGLLVLPDCRVIPPMPWLRAALVSVVAARRGRTLMTAEPVGSGDDGLGWIPPYVERFARDPRMEA